MRKRIGTLLITTMLATAMLAGCGSQEAKQEETKAQTEVATENNEAKEELIFVNFRDIRDLNPHLFGGEMYAQEMIFETLVTLNGDGGYDGCLAESWDISEDGKTYTFHIRDGIKFTDGAVCDAYAIKANFDAVIDNISRHVWTWMNFMDGVDAPDEKTFIIKLKEPYYPLLTELAVTRPFAMASPNVMKDGKTKDGITDIIGTGPYILKEFVTDEYAIFERNEDYWGQAPKIKRIVAKVIPDNQTRIMALEKGEIDIIYGKNMIDANTILQYQNNDKFTVMMSEPTSTRQILLNTTNDILKDKAVRQALQHATNKQAISDGVFNGLEKPADTLFAKTIPYCNVDLKPYDYNVETAEKMLDDAGWKKDKDGIREKDGKKLELKLLYNSNSVTEQTIAEYLQSEYKKIGIIIHPEGQEEQSYRDNMKAGTFDMVFNICWGTPYDPQSSLAAMREPCYGDCAAQQGLADKKEIDKAITKVLTTTNEKDRQELYDFILTSFHEDAVYIPLTYECNKTIFRSDLKGVHFPVSQYEIPFWDMYFE